jgi:uracil-DNA glycosylase
MKIEVSWKSLLEAEARKPYFQTLSAYVKTEYAKHTVYPQAEDVFRAFDLCPRERVRVVILGQDPYHGPGQANGLCFAVHENVPIPPSLKNIFKEISSDMGYEPDRTNGDLSRWARQGVLLLNATLTVRAEQAGSHQKKGWEAFTTAVIEELSKNNEKIVFILWGNYARAKGACIDRTKHHVLESAHPSPLSAYNGFFGSRPFSKTNEYLAQNGFAEIDWR